MTAEVAKAFARQRQEQRAMHLAGDATRATGAGRTEVDARAVGKARSNARRKAQRQAKRDATARADAALAPCEARVTEEDRRRGREERPEHTKADARAAKQRETNARPLATPRLAPARPLLHTRRM